MEENYGEKALEVIKNKKAMMISGGGTLGIAEVGALFRLQEVGLNLRNIKKIKGSSVGSIIATGMACGADTKYIKDTMENINFKEFEDHDCFLHSLYQLVTKYGLNKTTGINKLASKILTDLVGNPDITFASLYERTGVHLIITYLSMNMEKTIYADHLTEPDSLVRETIVKSSSIPIFFEGYFERSENGKCKMLSVDGGTLDNYSFNYLRDDVEIKDILGLKFISNDEIKNNKGEPKNVIDYVVRLVYLMRKQAMKLHVKENDWMSSVKINVGNLTSTDFNLSKDEKEWLFNQGYESVNSYIMELENLITEGKY